MKLYLIILTFANVRFGNAVHNGKHKSILSIIEESTCAENCSGHGTCVDEQPKNKKTTVIVASTLSAIVAVLLSIILFLVCKKKFKTRKPYVGDSTFNLQNIEPSKQMLERSNVGNFHDVPVGEK